MFSLTCGIFKNDTHELIYETEIDSQTQKTNLWFVTKGNVVGDIKEEFGINIFRLLHVK